MLLSKLKIATAVLLGVTIVSAGVGRCLYPQESANPVREPQARKEANPSTAPPKNFKKGGGKKGTKNILRNAGFEEGDRLPAYWIPGAEIDGVQYVWDKEAGQRGKASISLHKTAKRYFPVAQWYQVVDREGDMPALRVAAQVKAEEVTKATIDVIFLDEKGEWIEHRWAAYIGAKEAKDPPASHDWKEYKGQVAIPKGTKKIQIALQIYGPGKVWFDEVHAEYTNAQGEK